MDNTEQRQQPPREQLPWEREVLTRLATAAVDEQRRARRWSAVFKGLFLGYLLLVLLLVYQPFQVDERATPHAALVDVQGIIADNSQANADAITSSLRAAFQDQHSVGVILRINSPGGSPVQAGYINNEIKRLRDEFPDKPLYAVITDIGASGGYYIAASANAIYADQASIVGSIGVVMNSFGFVDALDKLGVERRILAAGENKAFLDPFSPLKSDEVAHIQTMLDRIHQQFVEVVREGRGSRLSDDPRIFTGLVWTGEESMDLGLVDGLGSSGYVAREVLGVERMIDYTRRPHYLDLLTERLGVALGRGVAQVLGTDQGPTLR
ncbi:S49 family peptidase [Ectothiorhodospiraceae bacterium 2226]|nr:S49 family peptidase [Ectothiorhodospiraceae bacterium 2226]